MHKIQIVIAPDKVETLCNNFFGINQCIRGSHSLLSRVIALKWSSRARALKYTSCLQFRPAQFYEKAEKEPTTVVSTRRNDLRAVISANGYELSQTVGPKEIKILCSGTCLMVAQSGTRFWFAQVRLVRSGHAFMRIPRAVSRPFKFCGLVNWPDKLGSRVTPSRAVLLHFFRA